MAGLASSDKPALDNSFAYEYLYPFPIADLYRKFRVSRRSSEKVGYALSVVEVALKLVVGVGVATSYDDPKTRKALANFRSRLRAPTLGTWLNLFREAAPAIIKDSPATKTESALAFLLGDKEGDLSIFITEFQELIDIRNNYIHGGPLTENAAAEALKVIAPYLDRLLLRLSFLRNHYFLYCEESKRIRAPSCFEATIRVCNGSNPVFPFQIWRLTSALEPFVPMLVSRDLSETVYLYPLLSLRENGQKDVQQFAFFHKKDGDVVWQCYQRPDGIMWDGTDYENSDVQKWLSGASETPVCRVGFLNDQKPSWSLDLSEDVRAPKAYHLLGQIGEGRYSKVYKAYHSGLQEVRAIKVLRKEVLTDPIQRKRFEFEAQIISKLRRETVAPRIFDYSEGDDGVPYLIMEYFEEGSLEDFLRTWGNVDEQSAVDMSIELFKGLAIIHSSGIVHRDVKLSNILVNNGVLAFCDFGSSIWVGTESRLTLDSKTIGTIGYMAPEQMYGEFSAQSDIYALGMCITHLLSNVSLNNARNWLRNAFEGERELRNILLSTIEPIASNRPLSASAVAERLANLRGRRIAHSKTVDGQVSAISGDSLQARPRQKPAPSESLTSPDGTKFRRIPAGEFLMGGSKFPDERPVHRVVISKDFYLASTQVVNAQFMRFVAETGYSSSSAKYLMHRRDSFSEKWRGRECPVVFVSWRDAKQYILWRSEKDDMGYFLPTEAQWEYACRAGTQSVYYWGNEFVAGMANVNAVSDSPVPVGAYQANPWGLHDMLGNVWEWCEDLMDSAPDEESLFYRHCAEVEGGIVVDPVNDAESFFVSDRISPSTRVGKGGSFFSKPHNCRPANRRGQEAEVPIRSFGFRLALRMDMEKRTTKRRKGYGEG